MNRTLGLAFLFLFGSTIPLAAAPPNAKLTAASAPYINRDFCAAVVVHPNRIASSKLGNSFSLDAIVKAGLKEIGFSPRQYGAIPTATKVRRITLLMEGFPGGNVMFMPAAVVEFNENIDGKQLVQSLWPDGFLSTKDDRLYHTTSFLAKVRINTVVVDPRTIVIAPEFMMEKMLSKNPPLRNLILKQLQDVTTVNDIHVEYNSWPALSNLSKLIGQELTGKNLEKLRSDPDMGDWPKAILFDVKSLSLAIDLSGDKLLQASADCGGFNEGSRLEELLRSGLRDLGTLANTAKFPKEMPKQIAEKLASIMKDVSLRAKVIRKADKVEIELPLPRSFTPFVKELAASVAKEAGIVEEQPFKAFAGTWEIQYSNGYKRVYTIDAKGTLTYKDETHELKKTKAGVLVRYPNQTRELLSVSDHKLHIKRYHFPSVQSGASRFPDKPTVTGTGKRKENP